MYRPVEFPDNYNYLIIVPFVIDSIHKGKSPDSSDIDRDQSSISHGEAVSKDTGILLALFAVGLLIGSPILGYLGKQLRSYKYEYRHSYSIHL